jgi:long-chain acyl-CoA synthetase
MNNSEAKAILVGSEFRERVENIKKALPHLRSIITFDDEAEATRRYARLRRADHESRPEACVPDDDAIIIYTSGTTGKPKGCLLTHGNVIANARQISQWLNFTENDRLLTIMPLFHMNAVSVTTMSALYAGGSTGRQSKIFRVQILGTLSRSIKSLHLVRWRRCYRYFCIPIRMGCPEGLKTDQLRFAMCGSAPVPAEVIRKFEETFNCSVIEGYGLSESTCRSTFNPPDERRRPGSCGLPIGNEMKVVDDEDNEVADGELGEIVLRGENILKGYFKNPEATERAFRGGWFHTGDVGYRDQGRILLHRRSQDRHDHSRRREHLPARD